MWWLVVLQGQKCVGQVLVCGLRSCAGRARSDGEHKMAAQPSVGMACNFFSEVVTWALLMSWTACVRCRPCDLQRRDVLQCARLT